MAHTPCLELHPPPADCLTGGPVAVDTIVIEVKFIEEQIGDEVDAGMESGDDQQHIRVLGRGGIVVLDANCLGDWNIQFHIGSFFNPTSGLPFQRHLRQQRRNFYMVIEIFGPNQFVLVLFEIMTFFLVDPLLFAPQILHGCLHLTYICRSVVINGVPKSSGNILRGHHRAGTIIVRWANWTQETFYVNREQIGEQQFGHVDLLRDTYGRYLFNGRPYSKRFQGDQYVEHTRPGQGD